MRKIPLLLMASLLAFAACKNDNKKAEGEASTQTPAAGEEKKSSAANQPKEYKVIITPDSAILGKSKEALVKVTGATAIALTDPDGKDNGIELTFKLTVTNKSTLTDKKYVSVSYADSRLQLDNGTNITHDSGTDFLRAEPEATSKEESWVYKIPAGAKPKALNLFFSDTRVSVNVTLE